MSFRLIPGLQRTAHVISRQLVRGDLPGCQVGLRLISALRREHNDAVHRALAIDGSAPRCEPRTETELATLGFTERRRSELATIERDDLGLRTPWLGHQQR